MNPRRLSSHMVYGLICGLLIASVLIPNAADLYRRARVRLHSAAERRRLSAEAG